MDMFDSWWEINENDRRRSTISKGTLRKLLFISVPRPWVEKSMVRLPEGWQSYLQLMLLFSYLPGPKPLSDRCATKRIYRGVFRRFWCKMFPGHFPTSLIYRPLTQFQRLGLSVIPLNLPAAITHFKSVTLDELDFPAPLHMSCIWEIWIDWINACIILEIYVNKLKMLYA